jgi:hypothetical protein
MPVTSVGAIFATNSKLLQRIYMPSSDDSEIAQQHVGPGETLLTVPISTYAQGGISAVQGAVGIPTFSGRCAVVDGKTNKVIDAIIADPAVYSDPRGQVIPHDLAMVGDSWTGSTFTRIYAQVDQTTGNIISMGPQPINSTAASVGSVLVVAPVGAIVGQNLISPVKLAVSSVS